MRLKTILGILSILLGIALIYTSFYIKNRVKEGRQQISEAQSEMRTGSKLFSLHPLTKTLGKELTESAQGKFDEATEIANRYDRLANYLQIGGAVFIVLGCILLIVRKGRNLSKSSSSRSSGKY